LSSYFASKRIINEVVPDIVIIYSPQYSINNSVASYCISRQIPIYFTEGSDNISERYSSLRFWRWDTNFLVSPSKRYWNDYKDVNFGENGYSKVTNHIIELFRAKSYSVYSGALKKKFSLKNTFNIEPNKKVALLSMSSHDEAYAAYYIGAFHESKAVSTVFKNQIEWVKSTIDYFSTHLDTYLIIRIHPKNFVNKRNYIISSQFEILKELLNKKFTENIIINWPSDNISLYNILPKINLLITGWSITALEASIFKVPVVLYDEKLPSYPGQLFLSGTTIEAYFNNIEFVLTNTFVGTSYYKLYQWWAINFYLNNLHLSKSFIPQSFSILRRVIRKIIGRIHFIDKYFKRNEIKLVKLEKVSERKFLEMINNNYDCLLEPNLSFNKKFICNAEETKRLIDCEMKKVNSLMNL